MKYLTQLLLMMYVIFVFTFIHFYCIVFIILNHVTGYLYYIL